MKTLLNLLNLLVKREYLQNQTLILVLKLSETMRGEQIMEYLKNNPELNELQIQDWMKNQIKEDE